MASLDEQMQAINAAEADITKVEAQLKELPSTAMKLREQLKALRLKRRDLVAAVRAELGGIVRTRTPRTANEAEAVAAEQAGRDVTE